VDSRTVRETAFLMLKPLAGGKGCGGMQAMVKSKLCQNIKGGNLWESDRAGTCGGNVPDFYLGGRGTAFVGFRWCAGGLRINPY